MSTDWLFGILFVLVPAVFILRAIIQIRFFRLLDRLIKEQNQ